MIKMKRFVKDIVIALKGYAMGAANVIPGVSGGTIALLTGIFGRIIGSLNSLMSVETWKLFFGGKWREFWTAADGRFLLALAAGVLASVLSLARLMEHVLYSYPIQTWAFFFGMIAASAVVMLAGRGSWKASDLIWAASGLAAGVLLCTLSPAETTDDLWFIFFCGALAICTMILPGISGSFILLILGKYEYIMSAINGLNIPVLAVFAAGCAVGILAFSKVLHWMLERYEDQTMLVLVGFVAGSLVKVWPWNDHAAIVRSQFISGGMSRDMADEAVDAVIESGQNISALISDMHTGAAIVFALAGIAVVGILEYLGGRKAQN